MSAREVLLEGGSPWGFRMHGGADLGQPIRISRVNPGSKAALRGVREGDVISSINKQPTSNLANVEAHSVLRTAGDTLLLGLNQDASSSPKRRSTHKQQQQTSGGATLIDHEDITTGEPPCSTATPTVIRAAVNNDAPSPKNQQTENESLKRNSTGAVSNSNCEPTKSNRSGGGRQKRNRRIKARKKALQESQQQFICEYEHKEIQEPEWEILNDISPTEIAHASPLLSAEALCLTEEIEPRPDIPTVEELKQMLTLHFRMQSEAPKRKSKRNETFPRRLEVITEEADDHMKLDTEDHIYEDIEPVFRAHQCYIYSDSEDEYDCSIVEQVLSDTESDKSIDKDLCDIEIIELNDDNKDEIFRENYNIEPPDEEYKKEDIVEYKILKQTELLRARICRVIEDDDDEEVIPELKESFQKTLEETTNKTSVLKTEEESTTRTVQVTHQNNVSLLPKLGHDDQHFLNQPNQNFNEHLVYYENISIYPAGNNENIFHDENSNIKFPINHELLENVNNDDIVISVENSTPTSPGQLNLEFEKCYSENFPLIIQENALQVENIPQDDVLVLVEEKDPQEKISEEINFQEKLIQGNVLDQEENASEELLSQEKVLEQKYSQENVSEKIVCQENVLKENLLQENTAEENISQEKIKNPETVEINQEPRELITPISEIANKLAHILEVTEQATSVLEQKLSDEIVNEEKQEEGACFSLSDDNIDSTYQLRQFLKSIRADENSHEEQMSIGDTPTHSRAESLDSNCSMDTTVFCDIKSSDNSTSSFNKINYSRIKALRELCIDSVSLLPNGIKYMLDWGLVTPEELLQLRIQPKLNLELALPRAAPPPPRRPLPTCEDTRRGSGWLPIPTYGPYFLCLSPAQQRALPPEQQQVSSERLLDLHFKVSQRRAYHEPSINMGLKQEQQEQRLKATVLSDWLEFARDDQLREKSPLSRFEKLHEEMSSVQTTARKFEAQRYHISKQRDIAVEMQEQQITQFTTPSSTTTGGEDQSVTSSTNNNIESSTSSISYVPTLPLTENDVFREQMFSEYQQQMAERAERRANKILRVSAAPGDSPASVTNAQLEVLEEFANRARTRMEKLGLDNDKDQEDENKLGDDTTFVIQGGATQLAKRIQEDSQLLLDGNSPLPVLAPTFKATTNKPGVWSPKTGRAASAGASAPSEVLPDNTKQQGTPNNDEPPPAPVWTPKASPTLERKEFRAVKFEASSPPARPKAIHTAPVEPPFDINSIELPERDKASTTITTSLDRKLNLSIPRLPRAQNPTVTLLQKAREGQLSRGALYLDHKMNPKDSANQGTSTSRQDDILYTVTTTESPNDDNKKIVELKAKKYEGIGPTTKEGIPLVLRSGIKEENYGKWYKRMYDSLHKAGHGYPYSAAGGYASEPEPAGGYDSDIGYSAKYATLDRRRIKNKDSDFTTSTMPRSKYMSPSVKYACEVYKNQPGRIEDYEPGHSSISDKEAKLWWDEVMDIFDGQSEAQASGWKPFMTYALKESGYESDSQLVFKRRENGTSSAVSPVEQKQAYKTIQSGGEVPLHGLRKLAPERPKDPLVLPSYYQEFDTGKESPHKFVESGEVTIHYRSPVRGLASREAALSEEELARRQEEAMRRIYQEERRRKYLQELHDMESRRHTDNFTPSQKSPIPLNRYDDFFEDVPSGRGIRDRTPEPKMVARALYNFVGQSPRELTFRRGDIILVRRQIDKYWYEGEHNASIGLFPFNYVEIIPYDGVRTFPKGPTEGKARAKFNFVAQTHLELSLVKGENVVLTRRVDDNWYEGRIGVRKGIFPVSYVEVIQEPGERLAAALMSPKPVASPASHSLLLNGTASRYQSGTSSRPHHYDPYSTPSHNTFTTSRSSVAAPGAKQLAPVNQTLHIDTASDPVPYRALYNYKPQNDDELELHEGETVYVMEKCDDGWYVGSSHRSGHFGTFPGNYVERM